MAILNQIKSKESFVRSHYLHENVNKKILSLQMPGLSTRRKEGGKSKTKRKRDEKRKAQIP